MTTREILRAVKCQHLSLHKGEGYWYFVFDNGVEYETKSVYAFRLNDLSFGAWVEEGLELISDIEKRRAA